MKLLAVVGTAGLIFLLGNAAATVAQEPDKPEKHDDKAKPEKQEQPPKQDEKPAKQEPADKPAAKPENKAAKQEPADKAAKPESKPAKEQPKQVKQQNQKTVQQSQHGNGAHGRIADDHYRASFGSEHHFHVQRSDYEHHRFAYGGYNFVFVDAWPGDWGYNDDVYVVYEDGVYYMYDVVHPGVHITLNIAD